MEYQIPTYTMNAITSWDPRADSLVVLSYPRHLDMLVDLSAEQISAELSAPTTTSQCKYQP